ncbi:hypothetical protein PMAYCL1PPCAC_10209, partial [Pristionchus mayeri]
KSIGPSERDVRDPRELSNRAANSLERNGHQQVLLGREIHSEVGKGKAGEILGIVPKRRTQSIDARPENRSRPKLRSASFVEHGGFQVPLDAP